MQACWQREGAKSPPVRSASRTGRAVTVNASGRSLGGKVRVGPGTQFEQSGSLREGQQISILENTGVRFDGYDWFKISFGKNTG